MEILNSIEVRWFFVDVRGSNAEAAKAWFHGVVPEGRREDRYLVTGRDDLGFKARVEEGKPAKVETKYLLESLGPAPFHDRVVGNVERWRKLSLELTDPALEKSGAWVKVVKNRRLRKLAYDDGVITPVETKALPAAGCGVELTELKYAIGSTSGEALTAGLEAFGPDRYLLDILLRAAESAFASAAGLRLGVEISESYPRWLARLSGSGA